MRREADVMGIRARRRAGVLIGIAGMLGGAVVGLGSVDGATAQSTAAPGGGTQFAASPTSPAASGSTRGSTSTHVS
jgi:hypothetical protein